MAMLGYFSVKLLVSPIIYVCDICLLDHFMLLFIIALPWILLSYLLIV